MVILKMMRLFQVAMQSLSGSKLTDNNDLGKKY